MQFSRDKRGYENTYIVHASRRRARGAERILYWFRTPPGIRVGRAALDEETLHLLERHHPDIQFNWQQILRGEEETPPSLPAPRPKREPLAEIPAPAPPRPPEPDAEPSPARDQLGVEGLARLRERYTHIIAAIGRRVADGERRERLNAEAERLNPDGWVSAEDVQQGLDQYEAVFESLRGLVGRRRRRRKPRGAGAGPGRAQATSQPSEGGTKAPQVEDEQGEDLDDESDTGPLGQD